MSPSSASQVGAATRSNGTADSPPVEKRPPRGTSFWFILLAICITLFLSALELTAVSTALPTIVNDLHGRDFVWVGSAYALASTAILPLSGGFAQIFGRRPAVIGSIAFFAVGSAICGAAQNMTMLIAGRTVQGIGGGGVLSLSQIVLGDLVSLQERGVFGGLFGLTWSIASAIGPIVGGSLSSRGQWRWLFYLNLPICGLSGALVIIFLRLPTPPGTLREKLARMDWIGNFLVIASSCTLALALTQGGINAPWKSAHILAPMIIGILGLGLFITYEAMWAKHPLVPVSILLSNRTSISGYLQTFFLPIISLAVIYYIPVYFQACKDASPILSGILTLGLASVAPSAALSGISVKVLKYYRPQIWIGWSLMLIGIPLFTTIDSNTSSGKVVGFTIIYGLGAGINYAVQVFPVQAGQPVTANAHALAFYSFVRSFSGIWGITIGGAILQNELSRRLPSDFASEFPEGIAIAYAIVPQIPTLPQPLKDEVRAAFADSLKVVWEVLAGLTGLGILSTFFMKGLPLHTQTDEAWALQEKEKEKRARIQTVES